jgi:hypothetical protein
VATVSLPFTFSPNTPAYSAQVNSNFASITAQVNGNLDDQNIKSGGVTPSRLATQPRAKAAITTPFNQLSGQGTTVFLGTAAYDTDNMYDDVNDYFTIQTAGVYAVSAYVLQQAVGAGVIHIRRGPGGVFPVPGVGDMLATDDNRNGSGQHMSASGIDYFAVGDRIDFSWYNFAGGQNGLSRGFLAAQWLSP